MKKTNIHSGLTQQEVISSRVQHGDNTLMPPAKRSIWFKFFEKLSDPIIVILLVALTFSVGVAIYQYVSGVEGAHVFFEPIGIFVAVLLATLIGFVFEINANNKFEILNQINDQSPVKVKREGQVQELPKSEVVVGDIIILETGDQIAADALLLEAVSLQVDESTLTGEPATHKSSDKGALNPEATYPSNEVLRGTTILEGHAIALVTEVGDQTEYGKVYRGAQIDNSVKTPLNQQLDKLATLITKLSYMVASLIIMGRLWIYFSESQSFEWLDFGSYLLNSVMIAVTVIVVSVPEGLPMSVTLSLALSMHRMLKNNNLVRKMHACETMGAVTVICTDKTGTLTQNKMQLFEMLTIGLDSNLLINNNIAINSTAHLQSVDGMCDKVIGNPTEGALLQWLKYQGADYMEIRENCEIIEQLPFSTQRKYMATVVRAEQQGKNILFVKGAPEVVMAMATNVDTSLNPKLIAYQSMAMRTIALAYAMVDGTCKCISDDNQLANVQLTLLSIAAISDPVRAEVPSAVNSCRDAGIALKIITGDTAATAKEIGRQIGLWSDQEPEANHLNGVDFEALTDSELLPRIKALKIISRARPMDKQRLVRLLQQQGEVVAVTGDGTNDAPALKAAQIGLSMGDGTSVAKEASDITILDNSFSSISSAVMWGRSLYQNIQRFVLFQLTINFAACLIVLTGAFTGAESPLSVTQMLWVNLIMDTFAALALASLPPREQVMKARPRGAQEHIITPSMRRIIIGVGMIFILSLFGLMQYFKGCDIASLTDFSAAEYVVNYFNFSALHNTFSPYEASLFFTIFVMMQFWNLFNAKAFMSRSSAFKDMGNCSGFLLTALFILVGQWLVVTFGGDMFGIAPLAATDWVIIIVGTSPILLFAELWRVVRNMVTA